MPDAAPAVTLPIRTPDDLLWVRQEARKFAEALAWAPGNLARVELIVTELATNMCRHAGGGVIRLSRLAGGAHDGLQIVAADQVADLDAALAAGYSTAGTNGDGLATVQELADRWAIRTDATDGTTITVEKWAP